MEQMIVITDELIFSRTSCMVEGNIFIRLGNAYFPELGWFDLVSSVLDIWLQEIYEFLCSYKGMCNLPFMDGPFYIMLERTNTEEIVAGLYENRKLAGPKCTIDYDIFLLSLVRETDTIITFAQQSCHEAFAAQVLAQLSSKLKSIKEVISYDCSESKFRKHL